MPTKGSKTHRSFFFEPPFFCSTLTAAPPAFFLGREDGQFKEITYLPIVVKQNDIFISTPFVLFQNIVQYLKSNCLLL